MRIVLAAVLVVLTLVTGAWAQTPTTQVTAELETALANQTLIASQIETNQKLLQDAQANLARQQQLLAEGLIARRTVEEAEAAVRHQQVLLDLLTEQKKIADQAVTLAQESVKLAQLKPATAAQLAPSQVRRVTRSYGRGIWSQQDFDKLARDFRQQFGHSLPISALGQTQIHERLGFNHSHRMDIAVSPDSVEGRWIIEHLQEMGVPYMAFRGAVPGEATGAHIHVGLPSSRL